MKRSILFTIMISLVIIMGNTVTGAVAGDDNNWTFKKSSGNVDFYYKMGECNGEKVIYLKFENKNAYSVEVKWKEAISDKTFGTTVEGYYGEKQLTLAPGITSREDCSSGVNEQCLIKMSSVDPTFVVDPAGFEFKDISVSKVSQ
jgi:hypothetical protein